MLLVGLIFRSTKKTSLSSNSSKKNSFLAENEAHKILKTLLSKKLKHLDTSIDYENYVGNVTLQGSTLVDSDYYDINQYRYGNAANGAVENGTLGYTINGYHPFIRLKFHANVGNIVTILAR